MNTTPHDPSDGFATPKRQLSLFDSTNIIVGIIIGAAIYESVPVIAANVPSFWWLIGVWLLGGVLSLCGALCYVELANIFPEEGGDYVYLTQAFGRRVGFLFAWCLVWVIRPGSIGAMAFVFARYANQLFPLDTWMPRSDPKDAEQAAQVIYAAASVLALSAVNFLGVKQGKWTQNVLTTAKVLGLVAVFVVGMMFSSPTAAAAPAETASGGENFALAMIFVLFAYGGWADMAYVGAEIRDPRKNIYRALMLGTIAVATLYILLTVAFVHAKGFEGVRAAEALAADVAELGLGAAGKRFVSVLICVSALGAINGLIFTGSRIYFAMGRDHALFAWLGKWNERLGTPVRSLLLQTVITVAVIVGFGLTASGFRSSVMFTTPGYWFFMVLVGLAVYQLRDIVPNASRPYRLPWYPVTPFIFCTSSLWMCYRSVLYAHENRNHAAFWAIGLFAAGLLACIYDPQPRKK
jgi:amino acid transporter